MSKIVQRILMELRSIKDPCGHVNELGDLRILCGKEKGHKDWHEGFLAMKPILWNNTKEDA